MHVGNELCATTTTIGLVGNIIIYLITKFNIKSIEATHIINISNGGNDLSPLVGAFLANAYLGCYWAIFVGSLLSFSVSNPLFYLHGLEFLFFTL